MASSTKASTAKAANVISSLTDLKDFIDSIPSGATLYLDLEGKSLSRNGTLTIMTILVHPTKATRLIDVQTLGSAAFTTPGTNGKTIKAILEDPQISKCFWDVRNDADALWAHYKVRLAGVTDIQLLENASRTGGRTYVRGLDTCVEKDLGLGFMELHRWVGTKKAIKTRMADDIFSRRPLDVQTESYCINDVVHLPALQVTYTKRINSQWKKKVMDESARRVVEACSPEYEPQSEKKKLGPWGSESGTKTLTMDKYLEKYDDERINSMEKDMFCDSDYDDLRRVWEN
ncbi:3' 5' exonuclease [Fusarium pseudoanthophilum]|uniref:3' 5' exonuclease n=1 Tax=Fusarium pseudoanthophilum TaxID=48495 RepID=A0A8H5LBR7_9HYPO|nr:3' 5' exonuclease [Fusarium pseudoanthophilum]